MSNHYSTVLNVINTLLQGESKKFTNIRLSCCAAILISSDVEKM